ncbi:RDD family protein [Nostoc sphaeroides]|uniref:RDD family protein n=1 Tax=Nostoc sphaeroides CCNUC1 TaxID=2653204 RepID=A0A5P8WHB5_9NOSO|nr:RDD family protein [Nostoc sphaeroides]QFS51991.1 RDD family protein [Nostoc sphaeroides CCNUC1]
MQSNYTPASLSKRFFAHLFDIIILYIITIVTAFIFAIIYSLFITTDKIPDEIPEYLAYGLFFTISWLYYTLMEISPKQATIGKQSMGIFVTDINGDRLSFTKASLRICCKIILSFVLRVSFITMFFTAKKQAMHDIVSRTLVVQKVKNEN